MTINTRGSSFSTLLSVYTNSAIASLSQVAGNDVDFQDPDPNIFTSRVTFKGTAGTRYQIAVDGYRDPAQGAIEEGAIQLSVNLVPAPTLSIRSPAPGVVFRKPVNPEICVETRSAKGEMTGLQLFAGGKLIQSFTPSKPSPLITACLTWTNPPAGPHTLIVRATDGFGQTTESAPLGIQVEVGNDNFEDRQKLSGRSIQITGSNFSATREPFERDELFRHPFNVGGKSVWYEWVCPSAGIVKLNFVFDRDNSKGLLMIFEGTSKTSLKKLANYDPYGPPLTFTNAIPGTTYQISVDGLLLPNGVTEASFTLDLRVSKPPSIFVDNPTNPTVFVVGQSNLVFTARVQDEDPEDFVASVNYRLEENSNPGNKTPIGTVVQSPRGPRYPLTTNFLPEGKYYVIAEAVDNLGYSTTSTNTVELTVIVPPLAKLWSYDLGAYTLAAGPAIGRDGTLYIGTSAGAFHAITPEGKSRWSTPFKIQGAIEGSAAIAEDGTIYIGGSDHLLHALNPDGTEKWAFRTGHFISSTPCIGADGTVFVGSWDAHFYAIHPETGATNWVRNLGAGRISHSAAIGEDGILYVSSTGTNVAHALRPQDGSTLWTVKSPDGSEFGSAIIGQGNRIHWRSQERMFQLNTRGEIQWTNTFAASGRSPALGPDGSVYAADGLMKAFNVDGSAKLDWKVPATGWTRSVPAITSDGTVYFADETGSLFGVRPDQAEPLVFKPGSSSTISAGADNSMASPAIGHDGTIYYVAGTQLYALKGTGAGLANSPWPKYHRNQRQTGNIQDSPGDKLWEVHGYSANSSTAPAIGTDGTVYFNAEDSLRAIRPDGTLKWSFNGSAVGAWSPLIRPDGTLVTLGNLPQGGFGLIRFDADGTVISSFPANYEYGWESTPAVASNGTIYLTGPSGSLGAYTPSGTLRWRFTPFPANSENKSRASSPAVGQDGTIYYGIVGPDRGLYAVKPLTGELKWHHRSEADVFSSPAIGQDGTVYYAIHTGERGLLYAVEAATGKTRWRTEGPGIGEASPVIGPDGTIYVGSNANGIHSVRPDGTVKWRQRDGTYVASTPVLGDDGILYAATEAGTVMAVQMDTGKTVWEVLVSGKGFGGHSGTLSADGTLYITDADGKLHAIKTTSRLALSPWPKYHREAKQAGTAENQPGDVRWIHSWPGTALYYSPAIRADGTLLFSPGIFVETVDSASGTGLNRDDFESSYIAISGLAIAPDGTAFNARNDGFLHAIRPDLSVKWRSPIGYSEFMATTPSIGGDGTVLFSSYDGHVYAFDPGTGSNLWRFATGTRQISSTSVGTNGTIYFLALNELVALRPDGTQKWRFKMPSEMFETSPAIGPDGTIFVGLENGELHAMRDVETRAEPVGGNWPFKHDYLLRTTPAIGPDGTIYLAPGSSSIYAINPNGSLKAKTLLDSDSTYNYISPALAADGTLVTVTGNSSRNRLVGISFSGGSPRILFDTPLPAIGRNASPVIGPDGTIYTGTEDGQLLAVRGTAAPSNKGWPMRHRDSANTGNAGVPTQKPVISLTAPSNGSRIPAPATITLRAEASATAGSVVRVEFFVDGTLLGTVGKSPYTLVWPSVTAGSYLVSAQVTDSSGLTSRSSELKIEVVTQTAAGNDSFSSRTQLGGIATFTTNTFNSLASSEPGEPLHAGRSGERSVWWTWRAPNHGRVHVSTAGSSFDTLLAVYTGSSVSSLQEVDSDDDSAGAGTSEVTFDATPGVDYHIAVAGFGRSSGEIKFQLEFNRPPSSAITLPKAGSVFTGPTNLVIQAEALDPDGTLATVEFFVGNASLGIVTNSPFTLEWTGAGPGAYILTAVAIDAAGLSTTSAAIPIRIVPPPPPNDDQAQATRLIGSRTRVTTSTLGAGREPGEPDHAGRTGGRSAWWSWVAPFRGETVISTQGSTFDTLLGVYTGTPGASLSRVAEDDDSGGNNTSRLRFAAVEGTTYLIAVDGFSGSGGQVELSLTQILAPTVDLTRPLNGTATFNSPANITLEAKAFDEDGSVDRVEFHEGNNLIGTTIERINNTFSLLWNRVPAGKYTLSARAYDEEGNVGVSLLPVTIEVKGTSSAPGFLTQPQSLTLAPGATATFLAQIAGTPPLSYQWRLNGHPVPSATNALLQLNNISESNAGIYDLIVTNATGRATSSPATLTVSPFPAILLQPQPQLVDAGADFSLTVTATNGVRLRYQWLLDGAAIPGATNALFKIGSATPADAGTYSVVVSNEAGSTTSAEAWIKIQAPSTGSDLPLSPREEFWIPNGPVHALLQTNGVLYLGGRFDHVGPNTGHGSIILTNGDTLHGFPKIDGTVLAAVEDGAGGWFIGGTFRNVGGVARSNLVHLLPNLSVDPSWHPNPDRQVRALALSDGTLYVGGLFTSIAGAPRTNLAALEARTATPTPWNPNPDGPVLALAASGDSVFAGGQFGNIGGRKLKMLAQFSHGNPVPTPWNPDVNGGVLALALDGNTLYAGGEFTRAGGLARNQIAAIDTRTGDALPNWNPNAADRNVRVIIATHGTIYVAGDFLEMGGQQAAYVTAIDSSGRIKPGWNPAPDNSVTAMAISGSTLYLGGQFSQINGLPRRRLAAVDADTGELQTWNPGAGGKPEVLVATRDGIFAGGQFSSIGGVERQNLAALDLARGDALSWDPSADRTVRTLILHKDQLVAGGEFTRLGNSPKNFLGALDPATGETAAWNPAPDDFVLTLESTGDTVFAGGNFTRVSGQDRRHAAAFELPSGRLTEWNPQADQAVRKIVAAGNNLFLAGEFTQVGSSPRRYIAQVDADRGLTTASWRSIADGVVTSLAPGQGQLIVGGRFTEIGGENRTGLATLSYLNGDAGPWSPPPFSSGRLELETIAYAAGQVFAGGTFATDDLQPRANLLALDSLTGKSAAWKPRVNGSVSAIAAQGRNSVVIGGSFSTIDGQHQPFLAVFAPRGIPVFTENPRDKIVAAGTDVRLEATAAGAEPMFLQWYKDGIPLAQETRSSLILDNIQADRQGLYSLAASNQFGTVLSAPAFLQVLTAPTILTPQPRSQRVPAGTLVTLEVKAAGSPRLAYQWLRNGTVLPGATNTSLTLGSVQSTNAGTYRVIVSNPVGAAASDPAVVEVIAAGATLSDAFAGRSTSTDFSGTVAGDNRSATREPREPFHAGKSGGRSVWIAWRAPASGIATFNTIGSDFDTLLGVYTGTSVSALNVVASDEDQGGFFASEVQFNAVQGTEYQIAVDGFANAGGNIVLNWRLENTSEEIPRILGVNPPSQSVNRFGSKATFAVDLDRAGSFDYQWFLNGRPITGATLPEIVLGNVQPQDIGLYHVEVTSGRRTIRSSPATLEIGPSATAFTEDKLADAAGSSPGGLTPQSAGSRRQGSFAAVSAGIPGTQILDNFGATTEIDEPLHGGIQTGATRIFSLQIDTSGSLVLDTIGSDIDTLLAVYTGESWIDAIVVASDDNGAPDGIRSRKVFPVQKGDVYRVVVAGVNGATGHINLNWKLGSPPVITRHPAPASINAGSTLNLSAAATGVPAPVFQWSWNGIDLPGETNSSLSLPNAQPADAGQYRVRAENYAGSARSETAEVSIGSTALKLTGLTFGADGRILLQLDSPSSSALVIESTFNLLEWVPVSTNLPGLLQLELTRPAAATPPMQFFRIRMNAGRP